MKKSIKFKLGMFVNIPLDLSYTEKTYTATSEMRKLIGSRRKIDGIYTNGDLNIAGWSWDRKDFFHTTPKKIPIEHFDPEELVT